MDRKEELGRQYAEEKVRKSPENLYKGYHLHRQMELTRFDGYDIQQAFEDGFDAGNAEAGNIWHNAETEWPENGREILIADKNRQFIGFGIHEGDGFFRAPYSTLLLYIGSINLWAYTDALFHTKQEEVI